jgi:hypothetical protein
MSPIYSFILADMWGGLEFSISRQIDSGTGKLERNSLRVSTIMKSETKYTEVQSLGYVWQENVYLLVGKK